MDDLRAAINYELGYQIKRGLIRIITSNYDLALKGDDVTFDQLAEAGVYYLGDPDTVARELREFYEAAGGFGTLLIVTGKNWATPRKGVSLDAAVHGAGGAAACAAWCRRAILTRSRRELARPRRRS